MQNLMDRIRPLVGSRGWDYCVVWRLKEDQRSLEWMDCCCAGAESGNLDKQDGLMFTVSSVFSCRDGMFQHQMTKCCELLSQLPSYVPLDSGIYAEALFSNQPRWLSFLNGSDLNNAADPGVEQEMLATRVLIPVLGGLLELFVAKQVSEDQDLIDFIVAQCTILLEHEAVLNSSLPMSEASDKLYHGTEKNQSDINSYQQVNQHTYGLGSPMSIFQQMNCNPETRAVAENGFQDMDDMIVNGGSNTPFQTVDHSFLTKDLNDKDSTKPDTGRSDSISDCSDQIDDEDDARCRKKNGKNPAKNLDAERRRRKKLNERLYSLRSLVPIISKLDKAHILVDAIEYVKQLKKEAEELQEELEQHSDNECDNNDNDAENNNILTDFGNQKAHENDPNTLIIGAFGGSCHNQLRKQTSETELDHHDKVQQMEPQVEVTPVDGSKFFIRVFCEYKPGGFVRLLEALSSLGLEVTNVNVTSRRMLVSNVFEVEIKRDSEVEADDLKNSLLELTRIPLGQGWPIDHQTSKKPENGIGIDYHCHHSLLPPYHHHN